MRLARACGGTPKDAAACATVAACAGEDEVEATESAILFSFFVAVARYDCVVIDG